MVPVMTTNAEAAPIAPFSSAVGFRPCVRANHALPVSYAMKPRPVPTISESKQEWKPEYRPRTPWRFSAAADACKSGYTSIPAYSCAQSPSLCTQDSSTW